MPGQADGVRTRAKAVTITNRNDIQGGRRVKQTGCNEKYAEWPTGVCQEIRAECHEARTVFRDKNQ